MVLILDTYIGCQEHVPCGWTVEDEGKVSLFSKLVHLLKH